MWKKNAFIECDDWFQEKYLFYIFYMEIVRNRASSIQLKNDRKGGQIKNKMYPNELCKKQNIFILYSDTIAPYF